MKRVFSGLVLLLISAFGVSAQGHDNPTDTTPSSKAQQNTDFLQAADEVLAEMSKLLSLPILSPLKKSLRSREEIRAYLLQQMKEDKEPEKRRADQKAMEKFGLIPKDYPLEETLIKVLTEQIAGLYDPEGQEFFIADWNAPEDQRVVMSHELTHALMDQHFHIDKWQDAAKPNDDAELARDAVIEGSAVAAMLDYMLQGQGSVRDLGEIDPSMFMGDPDDSPELAKAPKAIQEELLFPYSAGAPFTQSVLKATSGWPDFHKVFERPPVSTQQIMHPDMYLQNVIPPVITLPDTKKAIPAEWKKLDENDMGEFGVLQVLEQSLPKGFAASLAAEWSADRYSIFENQNNKRTLLLFRLRLASSEHAARFFGAYSEVLESKYDQRTNALRRPNFFSFDTPEDGVFLRCVEADCFVLEGGNRVMFDRLTVEMGWPAGPVVPVKPGDSHINQTALPAFPNLLADAGQPRLHAAR